MVVWVFKLLSSSGGLGFRVQGFGQFRLWCLRVFFELFGLWVSGCQGGGETTS